MYRYLHPDSSLRCTQYSRILYLHGYSTTVLQVLIAMMIVRHMPHIYMYNTAAAA
jgi:hypothetical protein